ncbi:MAG: hypothetical protein QME96_14040 [Myxococcota bacterium]|nr:hypothetical protein [Myxococcota bacterium]
MLRLPSLRTLVRGGLLANTLSSTGLLDVTFDRPVKGQPICPPPSSGKPPGKPSYSDPDDIYR